MTFLLYSYEEKWQGEYEEEGVEYDSLPSIFL